MKKKTTKEWIALILKGILIALVAVFTGTESINFFTFVFPAEQWYLAYTGFGLTLGALVVYLYLLVNEAKTSLQRTVSLLMIAAGILGELATAGFGMQIEAWKNANFTLTESDYTLMITIVRLMILGHGLALLAYGSGDKLIAAWNDDDGDGIPNWLDKKDNRRPAFAATTPAVDTQKPQNRRSEQNQGTTWTLADLTEKTGKNAAQLRKEFADYDAFSVWCSGQFDHISGGNMKRIWYGEVKAGGNRPS